MGTVRNLIMRIAGSLLIVAVATYLTDMVDAEVIGTIDVGSVGTIYVWKQFGNIVMEGNGFRMTGDSRGYLLTKDPGASLTPDSFWQTNLFDQHFTYDLNLSGVGCHCNAAGYFIKMPAQVPGGGGDYYCDANYMGGCGSSSWYTGGYCPGGGCTINSDQEFWVSHYQNNDIANTYMEQNGQGINFNICDQSWYWGVMGNHYSNMVFSMSLWGGPGIDMGWMDGITGCGGECNIGSATATFKNFKVGDYKEKIEAGLARTAANSTLN